MKNICTLLATFVLAWLINGNVMSQAGTIDSTFNNVGYRLYDHGTVHDNGRGVITLSDTTAVIYGSAELNGSVVGVLFRIKENSDIDSTFGVDNGYTEIQAGDQSLPAKLLQQPDGKYLVCGTVQTTPPLDEAFFVARYLTDGSPDPTFGTNGIAVIDYSPTDLDNCNAMALQADGKIVLAGRTYAGSSSQLLFARVNSDGTLDTSFGSNGFTEINASTQDEEIRALGILSNGTIVGVGDGYQGNPMWGHQLIMAKLHADGSPMTSYGGNGVMIPPFITDISTAFGMVIQNDSIFMTGRQNDPSNNTELLLAKMDSSGIADPSFGAGGVVFFKANGNISNTGLDILLGEDGKIYNSGTTGSGGLDTEFLLIRFFGDGSFDTSFDGDGWVSTDIRSDWDEAFSLDMQPDGKIIMTGNSGGLTNSGENKIPVARYLNDFVPFGADFIADADTSCEGSTVNYTDQSSGNIISWNWTFEGGSPATSTDQHPTVTYSTAGAYDVSLEVSDGTNISTLLRNDFIVVEAIPAQPATPVGSDNVCGNEEYVYTTNSVQYADTYYWQLTPSDAGTLTPNDTSATLSTAGGWNGAFTIKVRVSNECGYSPWSAELNAVLYFTPAAFNVQGGGGFCEGSSGLEVTLDGSEVDVDYELFLDDVSTGIIVAGTGNPISFGYQTEEGIFSVTGFSTNCSTDMYGGAYIYLLDPPGAATQPTGQEEVCANSLENYQTDPVSDADTLIWALNPAESGTITGSGETITVAWSANYSGLAYLSVYGSNDCGDGPVSDELEIDVLAAPQPEITGEDLVCVDHENSYSTTDNAGSTYSWEVVGGDIVSGSGTHEIHVLWTVVGDGYILVSETNGANCEGISDSLHITIDDCIGLGETTIKTLVIYPNPAKDLITISAPSLTGTSFDLRIYNQFGQRVYREENLRIEEQGTHQLHTALLPNGLYVVKMIGAVNQIYQSRFEVLR